MKIWDWATQQFVFPGADKKEEPMTIPIKEMKEDLSLKKKATHEGHWDLEGKWHPVQPSTNETFQGELDYLRKHVGILERQLAAERNAAAGDRRAHFLKEDALHGKIIDLTNQNHRLDKENKDLKERMRKSSQRFIVEDEHPPTTQLTTRVRIVTIEE